MEEEEKRKGEKKKEKVSSWEIEREKKKEPSIFCFPTVESR